MIRQMTLKERLVLKVALRALKAEFYNSLAKSKDNEAIKKHVQDEIAIMDQLISIFNDQVEIKHR